MRCPQEAGKERIEKNPLAKENATLQKENERLRLKLKKAETIIEFQKKYRRCWGSPRIRTKRSTHERCHCLSQDVGKKPACEALGMPRATFYRHAGRAEAQGNGDACRPIPPLALTPVERQEVTAILTSERFQDKAPYEVYATLLDEGQYHCSIRTMYRILQSNGAVKERRRGHQRSHYSKPELLATGPNQVWSWDITKLKGPPSGPTFTSM